MSTVPADGLAPFGARSSVGKSMPNFAPCMYDGIDISFFFC